MDRNNESTKYEEEKKRERKIIYSKVPVSMKTNMFMKAMEIVKLA